VKPGGEFRKIADGELFDRPADQPAVEPAQVAAVGTDGVLRQMALLAEIVGQRVEPVRGGVGGRSSRALDEFTARRRNGSPFASVRDFFGSSPKSVSAIRNEIELVDDRFLFSVERRPHPPSVSRNDFEYGLQPNPACSPIAFLGRMP
jgi:hypothetical protein